MFILLFFCDHTRGARVVACNKASRILEITLPRVNITEESKDTILFASFFIVYRFFFSAWSLSNNCWLRLISFTV